MADLKISQFVDGGAVQSSDEIATNRSGVNTKVFVGTAAGYDTGTGSGQIPLFDDFGDAAFLNANNLTGGLPLLEDVSGNPGLPAIDGSQLLNLPSSGGTVESVSVVSANGFAGSVATSTTTPAITISTSITGLLKGDGTAVSAAVAGTDYATAAQGALADTALQPGEATKLTLVNAVNSTSGTFIDFTGIPSSAKRVTLKLFDVSTNGTGYLNVGLGGVSIETTGYAGSVSEFGGSVSTLAHPSSSFNITGTGGATKTFSGVIVFDKIDYAQNIWVCGIKTARSDAAGVSVGAGTKTLLSALSMLRLGNSSSSNFDGGMVSLSIEQDA